MQKLLEISDLVQWYFLTACSNNEITKEETLLKWNECSLIDSTQQVIMNDKFNKSCQSFHKV